MIVSGVPLFQRKCFGRKLGAERKHGETSCTHGTSRKHKKTAQQQQQPQNRKSGECAYVKLAPIREPWQENCQAPDGGGCIAREDHDRAPSAQRELPKKLNLATPKTCTAVSGPLPRSISSSAQARQQAPSLSHAHTQRPAARGHAFTPSRCPKPLPKREQQRVRDRLRKGAGW